MCTTGLYCDGPHLRQEEICLCCSSKKKQQSTNDQEDQEDQEDQKLTGEAKQASQGLQRRSVSAMPRNSSEEKSPENRQPSLLSSNRD